MWSLDETVTHLNHGSFGATPTPVLAVQQRWRDLMEANPVRFMVEQYQPALEAARTAVAEFVGADPANLVFVRNATEGVNAVLRSLASALGPGDEIIVTNHGYAACTNAARAVARERRATIIEVAIPFPILERTQILDPIVDAVGDRTALVLVDHVTSPTGLVFPLDELIAVLGEIPVLVDGAHAPGMIELDLQSLGGAFYAGNCHKWMCAPKGAGFLVVEPEYHDRMYAPVISHSYGGDWQGSLSAFHANFDWTGTDDFTARLSVPAALETMAATHDDGWPGVMASNHELALAARDVLCKALGIPVPVPDLMLGSLAALPLPGGDGQGNPSDPLTAWLRHEHAMEVPVYTVPGLGRIIRISAQRYNRIADYERLADALGLAGLDTV
jgi:isopenicillin-N epimerase